MKKNDLKLMACLPIAAILVGCGRTTIDPNEYVEVKYDGMDTVARAYVEIDYEKMVTDNLKAFGIKSKKDDHAIERAAGKLEKYLSGELDKTSELSNGDEIVFEWNDDDVDKLEKKYKIKLKISDKNITVKDLEEPKKFDPFDYLEVSYTGVGPDGQIQLDYSDLPVDYVSFYADPSYGLSNGDKVKVTFGYSEDSAKEECFSQGYLPESFEKEYTVEGLQQYASKISEIDKKSYDKMDKYAQDRFMEDVEDNWEKKELKDLELLGVNLYIPKEENYSMKNALCYVYKVTTTLKGEEKKEEEPTTEAPTTTAEATTEAPTTTAEEKKEEGTTTAKADEKKEDATEATAEKKEDKKEEAKKGEKVYYYFAYYQNVLTPGDPDKEYDAQSYNEPSYSNFFGVSGDAFSIDDVLYVGYENLDDLYKAVEDKFYYECKKETNIKKN
ncbi:hypothetical protein [Ruminococcus flavefaciens]|uniref:hypothetical protein n=1 Tax=Ruminococcus flavefaciens TaxID=1265 RepID=UPI00048DE752|nr:hypothetical protein [Ruminococcus flavefaciens]